MAYHYERSTGDLVIDGFENGIAVSPHRGIANIQSGNISTETGEVMCNFARTQQSVQNITTGTLTPVDTSHLTPSALTPNAAQLTGGVWITISASTIPSLSTGDYYVLSSSAGFTSVLLSSTYGGSAVTFTASGSATFNIKTPMAQPLASVTETYQNSSNVVQYRYYVVDVKGTLWVYDTAVVDSSNGLSWIQPNKETISSGGNAKGLGLVNGYLFLFVENTIYVKETALLGVAWNSIFKGLNTPLGSTNSHAALTDQNNTLYFCDGDIVQSIFPNSVSSAGNANIWSYGTATFDGANADLSITDFIGGDIPVVGQTITFTSSGSLPTGFVANTVYYVISHNVTGNPITFKVSGTVGGGAITPIGGSGTLYFNSFNPQVVSNKPFKDSWTQGNSVALPLAAFEKTQCLAFNNGSLLVGCASNNVYLWDTVTATGAQDVIPLPENDAHSMITVNNMVYVFAGHKGNVYITNGSTASLVISVPDYCAGVPGTPSSYFEPYFTWGGTMYLRGRVWFSILDQTSAKAGNCGGVWSFVPTQNFYIGQDTGLALRQENQASYGTYSGVSTVLISSQVQTALGPQYWNAWYSSVSGATYGIDFTSTTTSTSTIAETDLIPVGTFLKKKTFATVEYKMAAPADATTTVSMKYRVNATDAWTTLGTATTESSSPISGYWNVNFQNIQWLQLQVTLTPPTSTTPSFERLSEIRIR